MSDDLNVEIVHWAGCIFCVASGHSTTPAAHVTSFVCGFIASKVRCVHCCEPCAKTLERMLNAVSPRLAMKRGACPGHDLNDPNG